MRMAESRLAKSFFALWVVCTIGLSACGGSGGGGNGGGAVQPPPPAPPPPPPPPAAADVYYYVSLGTSLSIGIQPALNGVLRPTTNGYADVLFNSIKPDFEATGTQARELQLIKLGCSGETLDTMMNGGICSYSAGSQLQAAFDFLTDNSDRVYLVTIDMGANDIVNQTIDADCIRSSNLPNCVTDVSAQIATGLATVLADLNDAASPETTIIGMNYYNPYLSAWLEDIAGQTIAMGSALTVGSWNVTLETTYGTAGIPVADVAEAFQSDDFATIVPSSLPAPNDMLPQNVANICDFTFLCDPPPIGPDVHATNAGYSRIAETIEATLP